MANINLRVARYGNGIIDYSEYNKSIHHGKIFCPACSPYLRVTDSGKGYFMAWKNDGGHNCGIGQIRYLDAEWAGREIVENKKSNNKFEVNIDIDLLFRTGKSGQIISNGEYGNKNQKKEIYYTYNEKKEIFRDVIRSVLQMKRIIEHNSYDSLKNIDFYFKVGNNERLGIEEVAVRSSDLEKEKHNNKFRFILFKVESVIKKSNVIYINAFKSNEKVLSVTLPIQNKNVELNNICADVYAIAFGKVEYYTKDDKFYLKITNDFQIKEIKGQNVCNWFENVIFEKYEKTSNICEKTESPKLESKPVQVVEEKSLSRENKIEKRNENKNIILEEYKNIQPVNNENNYRDSVNKQQYRSNNKVGFIKNIMNKIKNKRHL